MKPNLSGPLAARKKLYIKAREAYYNSASGKTLMSDADFDALEDSIKREDPKWPGLKSTGVKVKKLKKKLPVPAPSLNKKYPHEVGDWLEQAEADYVCVSKKLDGTSLELVYEGGLPRQCYTRGDGITGGEVSFLIPHMKIPRKIGYKKRLVLRCEGIFAKSAFQRYKHEFDNPRNAASGIMNRDSHNVHTSIKDLNVVVIRMLDPWMSPCKGLEAAKKMGFTVVGFRRMPLKMLFGERLARILENNREGSQYDMDGLVLEWDKVNPKPTAEKPKTAIAFKTNVSEEDAPTATVKSIFWKVSSHGVIVPKAILEPVKFDGVTVKQATLNNAGWMIERKIGPGAKVKLIRSGEIIPKIINVLKPGKVALPSKSQFGEWKWDKTHTQIVLVNALNNEDVQIRKIVKFFTKMKVDFIKEGTVRKMYAAGLDSVKKILMAKPQNFMKIEGIQDKSAQKLYESIQRFMVSGSTLPLIMEASHMFPRGLGAKRIANIQKEYPNLLGLTEYSSKALVEMIAQVPMFNVTTAQMFVDGIYRFRKFYEKLGIKIKKPEKIKLASNKLKGMGVTWTSYRSDEEEETVKKNGGNIVSFGGSTQVLLYSPSGKASSKLDKARAKGIPVLTWEQFRKKYL
jgi:DNA ligase (NAD+)